MVKQFAKEVVCFDFVLQTGINYTDKNKFSETHWKSLKTKWSDDDLFTIVIVIFLSVQVDIFR